jgi:hypothetical protein
MTSRARVSVNSPLVVNHSNPHYTYMLPDLVYLTPATLATLGKLGSSSEMERLIE